MVLFTLLGVIALIQRETHSGQDEKVDQSDVPAVRSSDGREVDDFSPEEPITSHSQVSDSVFQDILGDLSEWRADVLHAHDGVVSKFKDDSLQTPVHAASDLSVDVPQAPVHATVECGVNNITKTTASATSECSVDVPATTVCVAPNCRVDVPETTVCVAPNCRVDVPETTVCVAPNCRVDVPETTVCVAPNCRVDVPETTVCVAPNCRVDVPETTVCVAPNCRVDVPETTVCVVPDCRVDVPETTVCVAPNCRVDVPETTVCVAPNCRVDVPETTVCVAPDCRVDVPETTVCVVPDCRVDVPETTVCVAPDCRVDVPKTTVCVSPNCRVDVPETTVCVAPDCRVDVPKTTVCVSPNCRVDVPETTVCVSPDCRVDVPKTTVCVSPNCRVDVPETTVCVAPDCRVDVPKTTVCVSPDCNVDVPETTVCVTPDCRVDVPKTTVHATSDCSVDLPQATISATTDSEDGASPAEFYAEPKSEDEALLAVFSAEYNVAVPQAAVCETKDTSVSPQSNQLQKKNSNIIEINSSSYKMSFHLGDGGYGTVYAATRLKDGLPVAVKFASKWNTKSISIDGYLKPVPLEIALSIRATQGSRVPEIIQLLDWDEMYDHYRMVLERPVPCQSLLDFVNSYGDTIEENLARIIMRQATTAAQTCCQRGVLHRDIKLENFLITLDTLEVKLIDFGCGEILTDEPYRVYVGTREYRPPEHIRTGQYHGKPATVWSLGFMMFIILCKKVPNRLDLGRINDYIWTKEGFSQECCHFMSSCLQSNPKKRLELEKLSFHNWFKMAGMDETTIIDAISCSYELGVQLSVRFETVYAATRLNDGLQVAVKFVSKKNKKFVRIDCYPKPVPLEVAVLIRANQGPRVPEIVQLLDWQEEPERYVMVLERPMPSEKLNWFILSQTEDFKENLAWVILRQVTTAVQECCRRGVFHRDIKAESFLINPETLALKLINFGRGEILTDAAYTSFTGEDQYCPPEYLITGEYHAKPATVWSLGILLFTVLLGQFPTRQDLDQINQYIWSKDGLSKECCHFICRCLQSDPRKRIELEKLTLHNWFTYDG